MRYTTPIISSSDTAILMHDLHDHTPLKPFDTSIAIVLTRKIYFSCARQSYFLPERKSIPSKDILRIKAKEMESLSLWTSQCKRRSCVYEVRLESLCLLTRTTQIIALTTLIADKNLSSHYQGYQHFHQHITERTQITTTAISTIIALSALLKEPDSAQVSMLV